MLMGSLARLASGQWNSYKSVLYPVRNRAPAIVHVSPAKIRHIRNDLLRGAFEVSGPFAFRRRVD
jgi:hypothetical protein